MSVAEVQAQLGADEALVLFLDTPERKPLPEESFIWVVAKVGRALGAVGSWQGSPHGACDGHQASSDAKGLSTRTVGFARRVSW